jgi:hypothetical protein
MVTVVAQGGPATRLGLKEGFEQPDMGQDILKDTGLLKPFCGVTVRVYDTVEETPIGME